MIFSEAVRRLLCALLLGVLFQPSDVLGQGAKRARVTPGFRWPQSLEDLPAASRTPKAEVATFLNAVWKEAAGNLGYTPVTVAALSEFRFARLGKGEICLAATAGEKFPWFLDIVCPSQDGFADTRLVDERMAGVATDLLDLDGDGFDEVISSEYAVGYQGTSTPPIYWYTVYSFQDGLPHDVSSRHRSFYGGALLGPLDMLEGLLEPPLGNESSERYRYLQAQISFVRLKYRRRILDDKKAGLQEAIAWATSSDANLQQLAVETLADINDAASIAELKELLNSRYQGVCRTAMDALGLLEHREVTAQEEESNCKAPTR